MNPAQPKQGNPGRRMQIRRANIAQQVFGRPQYRETLAALAGPARWTLAAVAVLVATHWADPDLDTTAMNNLQVLRQIQRSLDQIPEPVEIDAVGRESPDPAPTPRPAAIGGSAIAPVRGADEPLSVLTPTPQQVRIRPLPLLSQLNQAGAAQAERSSQHGC